MRFLAISLGFNAPGPDRVGSKERLDQIVAAADRAEQAGLDGFGVGEHHTPDTEVSAPPVLLAAIAVRTSRIRLFTAVTVLSVLDPVRVAEDYATLDNLSGGRVEMIIGKGNTEVQARVFGYSLDDQWERNAEKYDLLRRLIHEPSVTWSGRFRPPLVDFTPRPDWLQSPPRIWHGSATSTNSTELAARYGDPLYSANVTGRREQYAELVDHYRERLAAYGHPPERALVGAGAAAVHVAPTSQQARAEFAPVFAARLARASTFRQTVPFADLDDAIANGSYLVGSPEEVLDQLGQLHGLLGHEVQHIGTADEPDPVLQRGIDAFLADVLPQAREAFPDRLWEPVTSPPDAEPPANDHPILAPTVEAGRP